MRGKSIVWLGVLGGVAVLFLLRAYLHAEETTTESVEEAQCFGTGILMATIERTVGLEGSSDTALLQDARLVKLGGRYFVRGTGYVTKADENDPAWAWYRGVDVAYAWEDVVDFFVFTPDQVEAYMASLKDEE